MHAKILEAGSSLNDKWLAGEISAVADKLESGEVGASDAVFMIEAASKHHAITCKILVGAVCHGGDDA